MNKLDKLLNDSLNDGVAKITEGGSHKENPLGGVPISKTDGAINMAEQGEVILDGHLILSKAIKIDKKFALTPLLKKHIGESYAEAFEREYEALGDRHGDTATKNMLKQIKSEFFDSQEAMKQFAEEKANREKVEQKAEQAQTPEGQAEIEAEARAKAEQDASNIEAQRSEQLASSLANTNIFEYGGDADKAKPKKRALEVEIEGKTYRAYIPADATDEEIRSAIEGYKNNPEGVKRDWKLVESKTDTKTETKTTQPTKPAEPVKPATPTKTSTEPLKVKKTKDGSYSASNLIGEVTTTGKKPYRFTGKTDKYGSKEAEFDVDGNTYKVFVDSKNENELKEKFNFLLKNKNYLDSPEVEKTIKTSDALEKAVLEYGKEKDVENFRKEIKQLDELGRFEATVNAAGDVDAFRKELNAQEEETGFENVVKKYENEAIKKSLNDSYKRSKDVMANVEKNNLYEEMGGQELDDTTSFEDFAKNNPDAPFKISSAYRPNSIMSNGSPSWHSKKNVDGSSKAVDIVPKEGKTWDDVKEYIKNDPELARTFANRGVGILDESDSEEGEANRAKTKGSGPHYHIGPDNVTLKGKALNDWLGYSYKAAVDNATTPETQSSTPTATGSGSTSGSGGGSGVSAGSGSADGGSFGNSGKPGKSINGIYTPEDIRRALTAPAIGTPTPTASKPIETPKNISNTETPQQAARQLDWTDKIGDYMRFAPAVGSLANVLGQSRFMATPDAEKANRQLQQAYDAMDFTTGPRGQHITADKMNVENSLNRIQAANNTTKQLVQQNANGNRAAALASMFAADRNAAASAGDTESQIRSYNQQQMNSAIAANNAVDSEYNQRLDAAKRARNAALADLNKQQTENMLNAGNADRQTKMALQDNLANALGEVGTDFQNRANIKELIRSGALKVDGSLLAELLGRK